jgi:uncharacterized membrane protein YeaQ/YmgE (transglycosylase-associated protein family)
MSLLIAIIIGITAGTAVDFFLHGHVYNLLLNSVAGVSGAIVGLAIFFFFFNFAQTSIGLFSLPSALCSLILALIAAFAVDAVQSITPKRTQQSHVEEDGPIDAEED